MSLVDRMAGWVRTATLSVILALVSGVALAMEPLTAREGRLGRAEIRLNHSETLRLPAAYADIMVGSPEIVDVLPVSERTIYILGRKIGTTNITVMGADKRLIGVLDVHVTPDIPLVSSRIRAAVPGARNVRVSNAEGTIVLAGLVNDARSAERAVAIASAFSKGPVINAMQLGNPQQVLLEVRVIEATRNAGRELGVRWDLAGNRTSAATGVGTGVVRGEDGTPGLVTQLISGSTPFGALFSRILVSGNTTLDVTLQALEERGLVRRLASPNLTALSGSKASFQAGGEFPIPVGGEANGVGGTTTRIEFKKFGVMLEFTPIVLEDGQINLRISPEVSELDFVNAVRSLTITVPSIVVRRATTEVMLRSGQSFAIAGLLAETGRTETAQLPWVGSIPILGALFRSQSFQKKETELVILATAHLARPSVPGQQLATPLDKTLPANDVDFFAMGNLEVAKNFRSYIERGVGVVGPYGHMLDITRSGAPTGLTVRK